jgi:hypothetical protein
VPSPRPPQPPAASPALSQVRAIVAAGDEEGAVAQEAAGRHGALGPALAQAIEDYNLALAAVSSAEAALEEAQRAAAGARARLAVLATGARVTGARALVPVAEGAGARPPDPPTT